MKLIEEVEKWPILYDNTDTNNRSSVKDQIWKRISKNLGLPG